jgi:hypothetical protein
VCIAEYFAIPNDERIPDIIRKLVVQSTILEEYILDDPKNVRKNALKNTNILTKGENKYGDPHYSLISYFMFFEDPVDNEENRDENGELYRDWMIYQNIDVFSSRLEIHNDIVLIELRSFSRHLSAYFNNIMDKQMKQGMKNGLCNRLFDYYHSNLRFFTIATLKDFIRIHDERGPGLKTRRKSRSHTLRRSKITSPVISKKA